MLYILNYLINYLTSVFYSVYERLCRKNDSYKNLDNTILENIKLGNNFIEKDYNQWGQFVDITEF